MKIDTIIQVSLTVLEVEKIREELVEVLGTDTETLTKLDGLLYKEIYKMLEVAKREMIELKD